jgi:hypothetical protein
MGPSAIPEAYTKSLPTLGLIVTVDHYTFTAMTPQDRRKVDESQKTIHSV